MPIHAADISVFQRDFYDRITVKNVKANQNIAENKTTLSLSVLPLFNVGDIAGLIEQSRALTNIVKTDDLITLNYNQAVTDTRQFRIGNKVIIDLFFDVKKLANVPTPIVSPPPSEVVAQPIDDSTQAGALKTVIDEPVPELSLAETLPPLADETILTISSVKPLGLAVFQRFNRLFVVTDQTNLAIPPQMSGSGNDLKWTLSEIPMQTGRAWMMPLPRNAFIRPEGKGLIWRVIISDVDPNLKTSNIRRRLSDPKDPAIDILISDTATLLKVTDPDYGDDLAVVTVKNSSNRMTIPYDFVDFDIIPAVAGAVIKPETDGIRIVAGSQFVAISSTNGLSIANDSQDDIVQAYIGGETQNPGTDTPPVSNLDRIYYFTDWGGGMKSHDYIEKRKELDQFMTMASDDNKLGVVLDLTKLTLSQNLGVEAFGYLQLASDMNPQIKDISEYHALRGAAHFLGGQYDIAKKYFENDKLNNISEAGLWHVATLAAMGDEEEALKAYNNNASLASIYPYEIKTQVLAPIALAMINQNRANDALKITELLDKDSETRTGEELATLAYLKGRAQSVTGRPDEAISNLYKASLGDKLGPYGIRSELLLITDELAREVIDRPTAIQRMERLRFAWRGDDLETQIHQALGNLYIENNEPRTGLTILKRAASNAPTVEERRTIVRTMANAYKSIFLSDRFDGLDPLVSVAVYDEFKELTPVGEEGNKLIDSIADKLMSISLMSRATDVLRDKMNRLGQGQDAIRTGLRIAAIELLDREPENALVTLSEVDKMIAAYRGEDKDELNSKIVLLKARGYSDTGNPKQALFMTEGLADTDDVIRLRIDTAWRSAQWVAVTENLSKLLDRESITASIPPTTEQSQLILNQAVALSLSDQYDALQRFADQYDLAMKQTPNYKTFQVVTRPVNITNLADRATLLDVTSEVDLFQGVLKDVEGE